MIREIDFVKINKVKDLMGTRTSKLKIKSTRADGVAEVLARMYKKNTLISGRVLTQVIEASCNIVGKGSISFVRDMLTYTGHAHQIRRGVWRVHQEKIPRVKTLIIPKDKGEPLPF
jgi:hypothetical protein